MTQPNFPGEFEQMVLLAILQLGDDAVAIEIRRQLEHRARRRVSRGALYRTLERMYEKGYVRWEVQGGSEHGGHRRRCFRVTRRGLGALKNSRTALLSLWEGVEPLFEPGT